VIVDLTRADVARVIWTAERQRERRLWVWDGDWVKSNGVGLSGIAVAAPAMGLCTQTSPPSP